MTILNENYLIIFNLHLWNIYLCKLVLATKIIMKHWMLASSFGLNYMCHTIQKTFCMFFGLQPTLIFAILRGYPKHDYGQLD
jgi:hypothetical protein